MFLTRRRGSTFTEVVISFVIVSLLVVIITGVVTSSYLISSRLETLPNAYYGAQDAVEQGIHTLKALVTEKYRIENELRNSPPEEIPEELPIRLAEVEADLTDYHSSTVTLFGKDVDVFDFPVAYEDENGTSLTLYAGTANSEPIERPVPIIDTVTVFADSMEDAVELYDPVGKTLRTQVDYNEKNADYYFKSLYQWYVCTNDFHTAPYGDGAGAEELLYGTVFAQYPNDYTLLPGETRDTLTVNEDCLGRFVVCLVTPLSIEGKMGKSVLSNPVYLSALPTLRYGEYEMLIEPSLMTLDYDDAGYVELSTIEGRADTASLRAVNPHSAKISLNGAITDSDYADSDAGSGHYSRYIRFGSAEMQGAGLSRGTGTVFAVVKNNAAEPFNFIQIESADPPAPVGPVWPSWPSMPAEDAEETAEDGFGFLTNERLLGRPDGWQIVVCRLPNLHDAVISGSIDMAELIFTSGINGSEFNEIYAYLAEKYHISSEYAVSFE